MKLLSKNWINASAEAKALFYLMIFFIGITLSGYILLWIKGKIPNKKHHFFIIPILLISGVFLIYMVSHNLNQKKETISLKVHLQKENLLNKLIKVFRKHNIKYSHQIIKNKMLYEKQYDFLEIRFESRNKINLKIIKNKSGNYSLDFSPFNKETQNEFKKIAQDLEKELLED